MFDDNNILINPLAVLKAEKLPRLYTLAEYLLREENSEELHEYYDGIITKLPMARTPHNLISTNMSTALNMYFMAQNKDYYVLSGQQLVYLPQLNISLYPDVLVVCETPQYYDTNEVLLINPVLIIEVLSSGTGKYDRTSKFDKYKTLDSFKEYVLINQKKCSIETRFREEPDLWREKTYTEMSDSVYLKSVDCSIELEKIYKRIVFKEKKKK
jgi:Uma2 family endonuclease